MLTPPVPAATATDVCAPFTGPGRPSARTSNRTTWSAPEPDLQRLASLTDREREVFIMVAHGLSNEEIADRLVLSPLTAETHVNRAMTKLGVRDRAQLVVQAYQKGSSEPATRSRDP